ncbi:excinuclease ABC subunit UvrA [Staphylococcus chromogenes]|nr:excinuclease ABC subunit UvrA [Staphylococcus chromogenes]
MSGKAEGNLIRVRDAHLHNLQHVDVDFPRGKLVAFTGVSGSGKSSLAFGTIHGEGQRRYLESVAPFARRLISSAVDPQVEFISGLPPTVALQQSTTSGGVRSTVGTVSSMSNTIRLLYSRAGDNPEGLYSDSFSPNTPQGMCPTCDGTGIVFEPTEQSMVPDPTLSINEGAIAAWPGGWAGKNFRDIARELGFDIHAPWSQLAPADREWILFTEETPVVTVRPNRGADQVHRDYQGTWRSAASYLRKTLAETESETQRKRAMQFMEHHTCPTCQGRKLNPAALRVTYAGMTIDRMGALPLDDLGTVLHKRHHEGAESPSWEGSAEQLLLKQLLPMLDSAIELGLGHLSLDRPARTLSGGEMQRVRLASQLRSGMFGVTYVLDEPAAGLHPAEREAVITMCRRLIDEGNSVLLVEHDMNLVSQADWLVDIGPHAGEAGGQVVYSGPVADYQADTPTARALRRNTLALSDTDFSHAPAIRLSGVRARNLNAIDVAIPLGQFTAIAGVSGSGKSTLASYVLPSLLQKSADAGDAEAVDSGAQFTVGSVIGTEDVDRLVQITQQPIGRTSRSTVATYTGLFDEVRKLFAALPESKRRKWTASRFSYNVAKGQCPTCGGVGSIEVELAFLPGASSQCPDCNGSRYNNETLEVRWNDYSIADVLSLTVDQATDVFADQPRIAAALDALQAVGLGYVRLGQGAPELSGGEAQRIKLATELQRSRSTRRGHTVYIFDEPTTGLHPADIERLLTEMRSLVDAGQTVLVVEHNLSVIAQADHVVELGPGAGVNGGNVVAAGTPRQIADGSTPTGLALRAAADAN